MNSIDVKNKLDSVEKNSQYLRVSSEHPLEMYLGKNEDGYLTLRYNGEFVAKKIVGNNLLEIKQVKNEHNNSLLFCYKSTENLSLFYSFCEQIINYTENSQTKNGYTDIVNAYNQIKRLFSNNSAVLSENEILGLLGELTYLKNLLTLKQYDETKILNCWSGPEPTHKDFSVDNEWYEIKTVNSSKNSVRISSIEQLDSELDGHLVIYFVEKMSPSYNGINLNGLVIDILHSFQYETSKDLFIEKLKQAGYTFNDYYNNYVYNISSRKKYKVCECFPRIKREQLSQGIDKVSYEINLLAIEEFLEV